MSQIKVFKKGESLIKEGEKAHTIYFIQSGSVNLNMVRQKQTIELMTLGSMQIVGEHALSGVVTNPYSAVAMSETKALELPADAVRAQIEAAPQLQKFLMKGLSDKLKVVMKEFQSMRLERDNTPCPPEQTAKIFGVIYHAAKTKGEASADGAVRAHWPMMKQYAQRVFLESPKRLENAVNIFVKLAFAKYEMVKPEDNPEGPDEIGFVHFSDLALVEQFFEFYQYYYFKGGKLELFKTDDRMMQLVATCLEIAAGQPLDRHGAVRLDYTKVVEKVKEAMGLQLNSDHFSVLENKGLFAKRQSTDNGVFLQFDFKEFERTLKIWKILREIERWNEKGSVDLNEPVMDSKKASKSGPACPSCHHPYEGAPKFCSECGGKLQAAA